jgi:hypothetical protein
MCSLIILVSVGSALINSTVDYTPFALEGNRFNTLGDGKNPAQFAFDFSFGIFGEATKLTFGSLGGPSSVNMFTDVLVGNAGSKVQDLSADKK